MEPQHTPPTEKQGKGRVLLMSQKRFVKIVRLVCVDLPLERSIWNTGESWNLVFLEI